MPVEQTPEVLAWIIHELGYNVMPNERLWRHFGISFSKEAEIPEADSETKTANEILLRGFDVKKDTTSFSYKMLRTR
jgi:hypothetical protein